MLCTKRGADCTVHNRWRTHPCLVLILIGEILLGTPYTHRLTPWLQTCSVYTYGLTNVHIPAWASKREREKYKGVLGAGDQVADWSGRNALRAPRIHDTKILFSTARDTSSLLRGERREGSIRGLSSLFPSLDRDPC